jgi:hypothetical protein
MEDKPGIMSFLESFEQTDRCPECGHPWLHDEPAHYGDCRYYFVSEELEEELDEGVEVLGWRSFRPPLL